MTDGDVVPPSPIAEPVVLVHGWGGAAGSMGPVLRQLEGSLCRSLQLPGLLGDDTPATITAAAERVRTFMEAHLAEPAVLVGHSMGAQVTTVIHTRWPDLVSHEVVVEPAYGLPDSESPSIQRLADQLGRVGHAAGADFFAGAFTEQTPPALRAQVLEDFERTPVDSLVSYLHSEYLDSDAIGLAHAAAPLVASRTRPVLAFFASEAAAAFERDASPRSQVEVFDGAGHFLHLERPPAFVETVRAWLRQTSLTAV